MRIDLQTRQWHELVRPVMPHAAKDKDAPELAMIRLEVTPRVVYAVATDRYTLGVERLPMGEVTDVDQAPVTLRLADADASLRLFPYGKDEDPKLQLTIDTVPVPIGMVGRTVSVDHLALTIESEDGTRLRLHDVRIPDRDPRAAWRKTITRAIGRALPAAAPALTINAAQLGRWAAAVRHGERLAVFTGTKHDEMLLVLVEHHFAGLWQPQNYLEGGAKMLAESPWRLELEDTTWQNELNP